MMSDRGLACLLFCSVFLPALAIVWRVDNDQVVFVLYREPKLAFWMLLGWAFLAALWWRDGQRMTTTRIVSALCHPVVAALGLFLMWATTTALWVVVRRNLSYELSQYLLFFFLLVCLIAHPESDRWRRVLENGLLAAMAVLTGVGILQAAGALPVLPAIDPQYGGQHASLMGYKNPMALALVGQLFLVVGRAVAATGRRRVLWWVLVAVEVGYLLTLLSRTSYLAAGVGCFCLVSLYVRCHWHRPTAATRSWLVPLVVILFVAGAVTGLHAGTRARLGSALDLLSDPYAYLETDRGVYLRNTLQMVEHRPWGVGLGDWQTHYPVYRRYERYRAYDDHFQVRRAHSDHVQVLGETGWLGLALWAGFWVVALASAGRRALARDPPPSAIFVAAQLAAFATAMVTDYVIEVPYLKLELCVVLLLSVKPLTVGLGPSSERGLSVLRVPMVLIAAVMAVVSSLGLAKSYQSATMTHHYLQSLSVAGSARAQHLQQAAAAGTRFVGLPGHEKTFYRSWLVLADTWLRLGQVELAEAAAKRALELHPLNPGTYRWLGQWERHQARVEDAERWDTLYQEIMHEAETGPPTTLP